MKVVDKPEAHFSDVESAYAWMEHRVDDECMDNYRFAYTDDSAAMDDYNVQQARGCCGSFDAMITVNGREAYIGCNYGH